MEKNKEIIELAVIEELEDSGVSAVSLVSEPAHEKYWVYMKQQVFVDPRSGETQDEFISRCMSTLVGDEGYEQDQAYAICINTYENKSAKEKFAEYPWDECINDMLDRGLPQDNAEALCGWIKANMSSGINTGGLNPYVDQVPKKKKEKFIEPNPCWEGYEAIGTKINDQGREVPNCVPIKSSKYSRIAEYNTKFATDEEKKTLVGAAMIPDMLIYRREDNGKEYYVKFSKETIAKVAEKFMGELRIHNTNLEHKGEVDGKSFVFESWIVETPDDKANTKYGLDVPVGTWMVKMKVNDPKVWEEVKAGKYKGFSIEGNFVDKKELDEIENEKNMVEQIMKILNS